MRCKLFYLVVLSILIAPVAFAEEYDNFNDFQYLDLNMHISSDIGIKYTGGNPNVEYIKSDLSFFPKDDERQTVNSLKTFANPIANIQEGSEAIRYLWDNVKSDTITYGYYSDVRVNNIISRIDKKVDFPLTKVDSTVLTYTQPTEFININSKIENKANQIIGSEDDLYKVVFKLADWTNSNIEYDLNTLTAEAVQPSTWVLENEQGVCDEMTNLFISFLRSVGIPARFVSGMVYTNIDNSWGAHGWAEVYFQEYGWVPFDVTFGEYGWLDPSHLKLKDNVDSGSPTAKYSWKSNGVDLDVGALNIETIATNYGPKESGAVEIEVIPLKVAVGFGSYVPVEVRLKNLQDSYVAPKVIITKAPGLTEDNVKQILLAPHEEKSLYWVVEIPSADKNYIYTTVVEAKSMYGETASKSIKYSDKFESYSESWANAILSGNEEREDKEILYDVDIDCLPDKEIYYAGDEAKISCDLESYVDSATNLDLCFQDKCEKINVGSNQKKSKTESFLVAESIRIPIVLESENKVKYEYVNLNVIPIPEVFVSNPDPSEIDYHDVVDINFDLSSNTNIKDLVIHFDFGERQYDSFNKDETRTITVHTIGRQLMDDLKFEISYKDELGKEYSEQKALHINVNNIPWYGEFLNWLSRLFN